MFGSEHKSSGVVSTSSYLFTQRQLLYTSCCAALLSFSRFCAIRLKMFSLFFVFFMHYLCEKYHKPITVQYYVIDVLAG